MSKLDYGISENLNHITNHRIGIHPN